MVGNDVKAPSRPHQLKDAVDRIADAGCILAALEKDFVTARHPSIRREDRASRIVGIIARFKLRNQTRGKRFAIRLSDGKAVIE